MKHTKQRGFTLVEVVIALAICTLLLLIALPGMANNIKTERFSGEVREFARILREAQTKSYSTAVGDKGGYCEPSVSGDLGSYCFWRGNVIEYNKQTQN